jgi:hypothetical protein
MAGKIISFCGGVRVPEGRPCPSASAGHADAMEMIFECKIGYPFLPIFTRFLLVGLSNIHFYPFPPIPS